MSQLRDPGDDSIGALLGRLVEDGRAYLRAEIDVVRATVATRISAAKLAIVLAVSAIFLVQAGLVVLVLALGSALALWLGAWGGQLVAALVVLALAGLMLRYAASHFSPAAALPAPTEPGE